MTTFQYLTADEWGGVWARPPVAEKMPDTECYVHHTAGGLMSNDATMAFRLLNKYAIESKGYSFLDYDVLVHYDPIKDLCTIGEGRGPWMSAATKDRNEQGEAVCVMGYFHPGHALSRRPHPAELEGTARAIVWGIQNGWIARDATILGHRDNPAHPGATGCPGDFLYEQLPFIRARVADLLKPAPVPVPVPDPIGDDAMEVIRVGGPTGHQYLRQGMIVRWIPDGTTKRQWADALGFDPVARDVESDYLSVLTMVGRPPA